MSTTVRWPEGLTLITPSQAATLPANSTLLPNGSLVVGEGNIVEYILSPQYQTHLRYEVEMRVKTATAPGYKRVSELLNILPTATLGGRGANEPFFRYVESMQNERRLIDVTGITKTPDGITGLTLLPLSTLKTAKYASTELPFVSKSKERYFEALDYYGGEGSFSHVRSEIAGQGKVLKPTKDIGRNWFKRGPYEAVRAVTSRSKGVVAKTPESIFMAYNTKMTTLTDAVNDLRNAYGKNPPTLPEDKIALLRQRRDGPYFNTTVEEINSKWYKYLMASVQYLFDHMDGNGVMQKGVSFEDLFNHFSITPQ
jgi:hypothetical protein